MNKVDLGVYIHIPFCKSKCGYCDFISHSNAEELHLPYKNALINEIRAFDFSDYEIKTVFIGGGTPTVLPPYFLTEILSKLKIQPETEVTVETNPNTANMETLKSLKQAGVTRLSIGLQAWQNRLLKIIGRTHTCEDFISCFEFARSAGFDDINIDIMFSLPSQTSDELAETLENVTSLKPEHISLYGLTIAEGTAFASYPEPDEILDRQMYHFAKSFFKKNNYIQYEISNFALSGHECKHNLAYWERREYKGFGAAAHSFLRGVRMHNTNNVINFSYNKNEIEDIINLSENEAAEEFMFLGLRKTNGVEAAEFNRLFNKSIFDVYGEKIKKFITARLMKFENGYLFLTDKGVDVSNIIFSEFLL